MNFERRDFLRLGTAGLAGSVFALESGFGQSADKADKDDKSKDRSSNAHGIELRSGTGSLHLKLKVDKGALELEMDSFRQRRDEAVVARGSFTPDGGTKIALYRSYFSVDASQQVFARLGDNDKWTTVVLSRTEDPNIESLSVWNDNKPPASFQIDKKKFLAGASAQQSIVGDGGHLDLVGQRKPAGFTVEDLENALDNHPDYLAFRRGKKVSGQHAPAFDFACAFLIRIPGGALFMTSWDSGL